MRAALALAALLPLLLLLPPLPARSEDAQASDGSNDQQGAPAVSSETKDVPVPGPEVPDKEVIAAKADPAPGQENPDTGVNAPKADPAPGPEVPDKEVGVPKADPVPRQENPDKEVGAPKADPIPGQENPDKEVGAPKKADPVPGQETPDKEVGAPKKADPVPSQETPDKEVGAPKADPVPSQETPDKEVSAPKADPVPGPEVADKEVGAPKADPVPGPEVADKEVGAPKAVPGPEVADKEVGAPKADPVPGPEVADKEVGAPKADPVPGPEVADKEVGAPKADPVPSQETPDKEVGAPKADPVPGPEVADKEVGAPNANPVPSQETPDKEVGAPKADQGPGQEDSDAGVTTMTVDPASQSSLTSTDRKGLKDTSGPTALAQPQTPSSQEAVRSTTDPGGRGSQRPTFRASLSPSPATLNPVVPLESAGGAPQNQPSSVPAASSDLATGFSVTPQGTPTTPMPTRPFTVQGGSSAPSHRPAPAGTTTFPAALPPSSSSGPTATPSVRAPPGASIRPTSALDHRVTCEAPERPDEKMLVLNLTKTSLCAAGPLDEDLVDVLCKTAKASFSPSRDRCQIRLAPVPEGQAVVVKQISVQTILQPDDIYERLKDRWDDLKEVGVSDMQLGGQGPPEEAEDRFSMPLIITIVCMASFLLLVAALYGCCHQRLSHRKDQQRLTEELQTVENGYHDNPTLEVMETSSEMQEKKAVNLNGELGDSWIVPLDNLSKDDFEEEEDTHL